MTTKKIKSALVSVYHKDGLDEIIKLLGKQNVRIFSTGGTQKFIEGLGVKVEAVEDLTKYPSIFGGRVKTLHPKVFGGILYRRNENGDLVEAEKYEIPNIDLVIVDLYPFEETVASGASEEDIIEKIDIGGISLIRAGAKNFEDVVIVPSKREYSMLKEILERGGETTRDERKKFAAAAFRVSSHYDSAIFNYFSNTEKPLRYGENPHQTAHFCGDLDAMFEKLHGKEISYNNLLDIDAAVNLIAEFSEPTFAVLKHNNACGLSTANDIKTAWEKALAGDPVSAFGGILIANRPIDEATAKLVDEIFYEVLIAPDFSPEARTLLEQKKNRILLKMKDMTMPTKQYRSLLNGKVVQDKDLSTETESDMKPVTTKKPTADEIQDMIFANKIVKHSKSNAIVLAKNGQLLASGVGQTSRVDALNQAIDKAARFGFDLKGAVMASDAFFPFPDCVEIASKAGITAIVQPGGSLKDNLSIETADKMGVAMVFTGKRHFKH